MCVRVACTAVSYQTSVTFRTHSNIVVKCVTFSSAWPREAYLRQVGGHNSYQRVPYLALLRVYPDTFFACFYPGTVVLPNHSLQHFLFFPDCSVNIISPPPQIISFHSVFCCLCHFPKISVNLLLRQVLQLRWKCDFRFMTTSKSASCGFSVKWMFV